MSLMPVCELWIPDVRGVFLQRSAGSYVGHEEFGERSEGVVFAKGEGLPGRVWASKQPEVLGTLGAPSDFVRAKSAAATGLSAGVGFPVVRSEQVVAALTFLSAQGANPSGVMEVWGPEGSGDDEVLTWRSGFYGGLDEVQDASMVTRFARGEGLPGRAWQTRKPELFTRLSQAESGFVRRPLAEQAGLTLGIAIPIFHGVRLQSVVTLLSTVRMPFGKVVEIWRPSEDGSILERHDGYYGRFGRFHDDDPDRTFAPGEGLPGQVWEAGMPQLIAPLDEDSGFARFRAAHSAELSVAVGIPIFDGGQVTSVLLLLS